MLHLLRHATAPRLDLFLTTVLVYAKPTHRRTRLVRWAVIQAIVVLAWMAAAGRDDSCFDSPVDGSANSDVCRGDAPADDAMDFVPRRDWLLLALSALLAWLNRADLLGTRAKIWMDPTVTHINRLPMRTSSLRRWTTLDEARDAACAISLSGGTDPAGGGGRRGNALRVSAPSRDAWEFALFPSVEAGLERAEAICRGRATLEGGVRMPVPSNWTVRPDVADGPIYTNRKYPFPCRPPYVPRENPTGLYRLAFALPGEWTASPSSYSIIFQ